MRLWLSPGQARSQKRVEDVSGEVALTDATGVGKEQKEKRTDQR